MKTNDLSYTEALRSICVPADSSSGKYVAISQNDQEVLKTILFEVDTPSVCRDHDVDWVLEFEEHFGISEPIVNRRIIPAIEELIGKRYNYTFRKGLISVVGNGYHLLFLDDVEYGKLTNYSVRLMN